VAIIYNVGALLGGIAFGAWSDRRGRRYAMAAAFGLAALLIPWWSGAASVAGLAAAAFLMQFTVQGAWGIIPAHLMELAPGAVRGFLPGFAYQCGVLLAANAAHWQVSFAKNERYSGPMAMMALIVFVAGAAVVLCGPERRAAQFGRSQPADFKT
jgi:SHS family lactate transporter-like MFS transporter